MDPNFYYIYYIFFVMAYLLIGSIFAGIMNGIKRRDLDSFGYRFVEFNDFYKIILAIFWAILLPFFIIKWIILSIVNLF